MALSGSINFLSASEWGSYFYDDASGRFVAPELTHDDPTYAREAAIPNDFVGLNTNIVDPITASENTLGHAAGGPVATFGDLIDSDSPLYSEYVLNAILHKRNGPYQHPMWKQIRGGDHPVARKLRLNNTMSVDQTWPDAITRENSKRAKRSQKSSYSDKDLSKFYDQENTVLENYGAGQPVFLPRLLQYPDLVNYYEPPVSKKHKPLIFKIDGGTVTVRATLMNQMQFFENRRLNESLKIAGSDRTTASIGLKKPKQQYYNILRVARQQGAADFIYAQTIFPKSLNTFRNYTLEKPNYEEVPGNSSNGYDRAKNRTFWRDVQPALGVGLDSDGSTRIRTAGRYHAAYGDPTRDASACTSSLFYRQDMGGLGGLGVNMTGTLADSGDLINSSRTGGATEGYYHLIGSATMDDRALAYNNMGGWNYKYHFIHGGIIAQRGINTLSGTVDTNGSGMPAAAPFSAFVTNESYQPYPIALLSMWPLDPRPDIYESSPYRTSLYLTSSIGGKGRQIGLTPHRMLEYSHDANALAERGNPVFTSSFTQVSGEGLFITGAHNYSVDATGSYSQYINIQTGTAGELVYSTKPTFFFFVSGSGTVQQKGYTRPKASLQYNRHTFPYNTPFYATNRVRGRNPFFNSYSDFSQDIRYIGRDHSIIPEFRVSDNIEYYTKTYFKSRKKELLHKEEKLGPTVAGLSLGDIKKSFYNGPTDKNTKIIKRNISFSKDTIPGTTKLNFLNLDGAFLTSSGATESLSGSVKTSTISVYNPETRKTSIKTLKTLLGYKDGKSTKHYAQDSGSVAFKESFSHTEDAFEFANFISDPTVQQTPVVRKVKFTVSALKKLLPYKDFFPVTKTVSMGAEFTKFIYEEIENLFRPLGMKNESMSDQTFSRYIGGSFHRAKDFPIDADAHTYQIQSFLEPFFAPGILYNSLKSGIAVDYPVYRNKPPVYFAPWTFFSGSVGTSEDIIKDPTLYGSPESSARFTSKITSSFNYGGFYMMGASRCIPAILNNAPSYRMPFEAIYNTDVLDDFSKENYGALYLTTDFLDLDLNRPDLTASALAAADSGKAGEVAFHTHPGAAFTTAGPRGLLQQRPSKSKSLKKDLYESSINNFLCETMNFFLADQELPGVKLPIITSTPKTDDEISLLNDKTYLMEVSLEMGADQVITEGPRDAGIGGWGRAKAEQNIYTTSTGSAMMRGYLYGPPIEIVSMSGSATVTSFNQSFNTRAGLVEPGGANKKTEPYIASDVGGGEGRTYSGKGDFASYFGANLQDPAYQAFTPPFFYGKSSIVLTAEPETNVSSWVDAFDHTLTSSFYVESYVTGTGIDKLCKFLPGTSSVSGYNSTRMKIDSSVDIFNKVVVFDGATNPGTSIKKRAWYIAPKWVCPVLDFSSSFSFISTPEQDELLQKAVVPTKGLKSQTTFVTNSFHDTTTGRGLWGGYGSDPYDPVAMHEVRKKTLGITSANVAFDQDKGVTLTVKNVSEDNKNKTEQATYKNEKLSGDFGFSILKQFSATANTTSSLGVELGFLNNDTEVKELKIGKFAQEKTISEAVVVIPYFEKPVNLRGKKSFPGGEVFVTREVIPGKHFLPINKMLFENLLSMNIASRKYSDSYLLGAGASQGGPESRVNYVGFDSTEAVASATETDTYRMIDLIMGDEDSNVLGYELPPEFDFVNYNVDPFQMIVLPVEHTLSKQELMDIYQGVMPESSLAFEKTIQSFETSDSSEAQGSYSWMPKAKTTDGSEGVSLAAVNGASFINPLFLTEGEFLQYVPSEDLNTSWLKTPDDFYRNLKFMTFKIKQKAMKNYDNYRYRQIQRTIEDQVEQNVGSSDNISVNFGFSLEKIVADVFGHNWPYDNFSLIEAAKVDIQFEVED